MPVIHRKRMMALLTVLLGMLTAIAPLSTDMYLPALPVMMNDFDVSPSMIQLTLTASMAGRLPGRSLPVRSVMTKGGVNRSS